MRLQSRDIDYITGEDDYARLHCRTESYLIAERLYAMEQRPSGGLGRNCFIRIHRSTLVNVDRVVELVSDAGSWLVFLALGERWAIGRSFLPALRFSLRIKPDDR